MIYSYLSHSFISLSNIFYLSYLLIYHILQFSYLSSNFLTFVLLFITPPLKNTYLTLKLGYLINKMPTLINTELDLYNIDYFYSRYKDHYNVSISELKEESLRILPSRV